MKNKICLLSDNIEFNSWIKKIAFEHSEIIPISEEATLIEKVKNINIGILLIHFQYPIQKYLNICDNIRKTIATQSVFLMAVGPNNDVECRIKAYESGVDDYIEEPLQEVELKVRIEAKIRRLREKMNNEMECGNLRLNFDQMAALVDGKAIPFSTLEFKLLQYFVQNKDKIISRNKIITAVWGGTAVCDRTVDTHLVSIRKKIRGFDHELDTVYGAGYILRSKQITMGSKEN